LAASPPPSRLIEPALSTEPPRFAPSMSEAGLSRPQLFFWLVLLAALNSFAGIAVRIVPEHGLAYAVFELFGISAIVWAALGACLALLREAPAEPPRRGDLWVAGAVVLVAIAPVATASALALTALGLWMIATGAPGSVPRRAGTIALAMTASLLWGRLLLALFSGPMLAADSWLVGLATGSASAGNLIAVLGPGGARIAVAPGCSSWQGMSLALLLWVTVNQYFRVPFGWRALGWLALALAATVAINVLRIAAMVRFPAHIEEIHNGWGWHVAMWTTLLSVTAICLIGARREVFR
jgi:exosortase/archaeosortase family protein